MTFDHVGHLLKSIKEDSNARRHNHCARLMHARCMRACAAITAVDSQYQARVACAHSNLTETKHF